MQLNVRLAAIAGTALVLGLSGCGNSTKATPLAATQTHVSSAVIRHFPGVPNAHLMSECVPGPMPTQKPCAAWAGADLLYVAAWGSGSCPPLPTSVAAPEADLVVIKTAPHDSHPQDTGCDADLGATTSVVRLPSNVDSTRPLTVRVDTTTLRLAPYRG